MLEYKDILINANSNTPVFSLNLSAGDIACLRISSEDGTRLLRASLGMDEVDKGFISFDGELVTPGSGAFFRKYMAYVPYDVPDLDIKMFDLLSQVRGVVDNSKSNSESGSVLHSLHLFGLDDNVLKKSAKELTRREMQFVLLSFVPLLRRKIVLIDRPVLCEAVSNFIGELGKQGQEVVYTTQEKSMIYTKLLNLIDK